MSKADRAKRRQKARAATEALAAVIDVPLKVKPAVPRGRRPAVAADKVTLDARCRRFGIAASDAARAFMAGPEAGSGLGMVLLRLCASGDEVRRIWGYWQAWGMAERTYLQRKIGRTGDPQGAAIAMLSEALETSADHPAPDTRSEKEKLDAAVSAWMRWQGYLGHLSAEEQALLHGIRLDQIVVWDNQEPTADGVRGLAAVRKLVLVASR
jgi:hypothetical protein